MELDPIALARWDDGLQALVEQSGFATVTVQEFRSGSMNDALR